METLDRYSKLLQAGCLKIEIHASSEAAGRAAAHAAAQSIRELAASRPSLGVVFATGASQLTTLRALTRTENIPWDRVVGFHMDEYLDIDPEHPASFRRYLREHLTDKVRLREFHELHGSSSASREACAEYAMLMRSHDPQLCLLGIGENGHLAFNDPGEANFWDPFDVKVVSLDGTCRQQQVEEGWFPNLDAVPMQAITMSIPALMRVPKLIISVPGSRKASVVSRTLREMISTACPSTILRIHSDATVYLDEESAAQIELGM